MKSGTLIFTIFFVLASLPVQAQEAQSDYEIQKQFREQYNQLQARLDTVSSVDSVQAIIQAVKQLDQKYQDNAELLSQALFPNTYEQAMEELQTSATITLNRVQERQQRTQKLESLQNQLADYEQNLDQLTSRTDSLQQAMQASIESEKELSAMVETYRKNLEKRDELILAFIDSMVVAYQQMDLQSMQDLENLEQKSELESDGNALRLIHEITVENLQLLKNNAGKLHLQDYVRMSEVQQEFQKMWSALGEEITSIYEGENSQQIASEVEQNISEWNQLLQNQTFTALSDSLKAQGVEIQEFTNAQGLYSSLNAYLNEQISQSKEGASEVNYEEYQEFQQFWNKVELQWAGNFVDAGILTSEQLADINAKVDTWAEIARPDTGNVLIWLLGALMLVAIILAVLFIRERQNRA